MSRPDGDELECWCPDPPAPNGYQLVADYCPRHGTAAPAAGADLREQIISRLHETNPLYYEDAADDLLAGPLRSLVEEAAEAARLRETVARVEALHRYVEADEPGCDDFCGYDSEDWPCLTRRALDGTDG